MGKISMYYGDVPKNAKGCGDAEQAHKIETGFFVTKVNYRRADPIDVQINERKELRKRMRAHPDGNRCPSKYNQIIKL